MNRVAAGLDRWIWITGWRDEFENPWSSRFSYCAIMLIYLPLGSSRFIDSVPRCVRTARGSDLGHSGRRVLRHQGRRRAVEPAREPGRRLRHPCPTLWPAFEAAHGAGRCGLSAVCCAARRHGCRIH